MSERRSLGSLLISATALARFWRERMYALALAISSRYQVRASLLGREASLVSLHEKGVCGGGDGEDS